MKRNNLAAGLYAFTGCVLVSKLTDAVTAENALGVAIKLFFAAAGAIYFVAAFATYGRKTND